MNILFKIAFKHSYYHDGTLQKSELLAKNHTANIFKRTGILMRNDGSNYCFYAPAKADPVLLLEYLILQLAGAPLSFSLLHDPTEFTYITEIPLNWCGQFLLSSNNIEREENGLRIISIEETERSDFRENAVARVHIFPEDILLCGGRELHYLVSFQARSTYWQYYLFNRSKVKLNYPLVCNNNGIVFDGPKKITMKSGEEALGFSSGSRKFSIQQMPLHIFNLVDRVEANISDSDQLNEIDIITGLPTPGMDHLLSSKIDSEELVVSEMYVYL